MSDTNDVEKKLTNLWKGKGRVETLPTVGQKYLIISDMHMGDGSKSDDFKHNEKLTQKVLEHYFNEKYTLILLGDIEELWQFSMEDIFNEYEKSIYKSIKLFGDRRIYRIYGNHDLDWKISDPIWNKKNTNKSLEAIRLLDRDNQVKILLVHGHQGTPESDKWSWLSKLVVKGYGQSLEQVIKLDKASSATKSPILKSYERKRYDWARKNHAILICGHSHRAFFGSKSKIDKLKREIADIEKRIIKNASATSTSEKNIGILLNELGEKKNQIIDEQAIRGDYTFLGIKPCYFNSGCAIYSDGITVIEIANDSLKLVKWHRTKKAGKLNFEVYGQENLSELISKL